jgi:tRNA(fMet)-specific endonuclease VapC
MTGNSVLLDTNIISALLAGDVTIADNIDNSPEVFIPVIVLGELQYGAQYSANIQKNLNNIEKISGRYPILLVDETTAAEYGIIKTQLRKKGKPNT